jgi:N-acetylglutamate synthase-like GNAT family acetyltransferase
MTSPTARELDPAEFPLAEALWTRYRGQTADRKNDRIFGSFDESGKLVALARCKRHPDGLEVDAVFTPDEYRGKGYARHAVQALVDACGGETMYMHSTLALRRFYPQFGFAPIPETELPPTIKERLIFCLGEMEGCNAIPMRREASPET